MVKKYTLQFVAFGEDADYFKEMQINYRREGLYSATLFKEMVQAFKEKREKEDDNEQ